MSAFGATCAKSQKDSGTVAPDTLFLVEGTCKGRAVVLQPGTGWASTQSSQRSVRSIFNTPQPTPGPLSVHGNVRYQFSYNSYIDTPYAQRDLMQHIVQTQLQAVWQEKYPFDIWLTSRRSNSPYFINTTDVSVRFRQEVMLEKMRGALLKDVQAVDVAALWERPDQLYRNRSELIAKGKRELDSIGKLGGDHAFIQKLAKPIQQGIDSLYNLYKAKRDSLQQLEQWVSHPNRWQEAIEAKERAIRAKAYKQRDSLAFFSKETIVLDDVKKSSATDSASLKAYHQYSANLENKKKKVETLRQEVAASEKKLAAFQKKWRDSLLQVKREINGIKSKDALYNYYEKHQDGYTGLSDAQKLLLAVKQIGIGRSWLDYSELTVKNISLNGLSVEMAPGKWYIAGAVGSINYRFRDFVLKKQDAQRNDQYLSVVRAGVRNANGSGLIFTVYNGKKTVLGQSTGSADVRAQQIAGISLAGTLTINKHYSVQGEYARSTKLTAVSTNASKANSTWTDVFSLRATGASAWSVKALMAYPVIHFSGEAFYRKLGPNFQSFTLFTAGSAQTSWMIKTRKQFWRQQLTADVAVRKNDFSNNFALQNFSSKTIFTSVQLTLRVPKYPFVSIGYYPSSQLTLGNDNLLYESRYKTINAIAGYTYRMKDVSMTSNAVFSKLYNSSSDSGFVYYNAASLTATQTVFYKNWTFQMGLTGIQQTQMQQWTIEPLLGYRYKDLISMNVSAKYSRTDAGEAMMGGMCALGITYKKIGNVQLQYDKSYVPGFQKNLRVLETGRIVFTRFF